MMYRGAFRAVALGMILAALTACGGGGGSGGDGGTPRPDVPLPDIGSATQKALTPDNSKQAVILALNAINFIENGTIPASSAVDFYADSFTGSDAFFKAARAFRPATKTVDVSDEVCVSGSASAEAGDDLIGTMIQRYSNCNTGGVTLDGELQLDIRGYVYVDLFTDVTYTFRGLRITSPEEDSVFDGNVVMTTGYPGAGFIAADLDVRDLSLRKGARIVGYRADFEIGYGDINYGNYVYTVRQLEGRIYDDQGEYFDLGLTPQHEPWPMLLGSGSRLTLSPSGIEAPYQVRIALDENGDNNAEYWLFAALDQLAESNTNDSAPEFHFDAAPIRLDKGESREVWFGNVTDADQQFTSIDWVLVQKPEGTDPIIDASADGFVFSSNVAGDYRVVATASDGLNTTSLNIDIRVMYDMPELSINGPGAINSGSGASFSLSVLNPEQGAIRIVPLALPGLNYDESTKTATYAAALPEFGVDQQINVGFVVSNEDRQETVTVPLMVRAHVDASAPVLIAGSQYAWSGFQYWVGQFTPSLSKEIIQSRDFLIDVFEVEGANKRYRESYDLSHITGAYELTVLAVRDVDEDGFDEILFGVKSGGGLYHFGIYDARRRRPLVSTVLAGVDQSDISPKVVDVINLDGTGDNEVVFFNGTQFYVFDSALQLQWQSVIGSYGASMVAANVDDDAALEMVTGSGDIVDGATYAWQQQGSFFSSVDDFLFAADLDGNGVSEVYVVSGSVLRRMTSTGYVDVSTASGLYSNVVVRNVDNDPADELLLVTMTAFGQSTPPICFWGGFEGTLSLGYLDLANGNYTIHNMRDFDRGCSNAGTRLIADNIDGVGGLEYILNFSLSPSDEFIYSQDSSTIHPMEFFGPFLRGSFTGGMQISPDGDVIAVCGEHRRSDDWINDIFTIDVADGRISADLTVLPASYSAAAGYPIQKCASLQPVDSGDYGVLSMRHVYEGGQYRLLMSFLNATSGASSLLNVSDVWDLERSGVGDVDGDGVSEVIIAGNVGGVDMLSAFGLLSGREIFANAVPGDDVFRTLAITAGDVLSDNGKDEILVTAHSFVGECLLRVLAYNGTGGLVSVREKSFDDLCGNSDQIFVADFNGDSKNEILISYYDFDRGGWARSFKVLDADLQVISEWENTSYISSVAPFRSSAGATVLTLLERDSPNDGARIIWRDGLNGRVIYQSPVIARDVVELGLLVDSLTSKVRAVISGGGQIYLTQ